MYSDSIFVSTIISFGIFFSKQLCIIIIHNIEEIFSNETETYFFILFMLFAIKNGSIFRLNRNFLLYKITIIGIINFPCLSFFAYSVWNNFKLWEWDYLASLSGCSWFCRIFLFFIMKMAIKRTQTYRKHNHKWRLIIWSLNLLKI